MKSSGMGAAVQDIKEKMMGEVMGWQGLLRMRYLEKRYLEG